MDLIPHSFLWGKFEKKKLQLLLGWRGSNGSVLPARIPYLSVSVFFQHQPPGGAGKIPEVIYRKHPAGSWPETAELISDVGGRGEPLERKRVGRK